MKKILKSELKHGYVYMDTKANSTINVFLVPYSSKSLNPSSRLQNICASLHADTMWFYDPSTEDGEVYLITTLKDIGEIIKESLDES